MTKRLLVLEEEGWVAWRSLCIYERCSRLRVRRSVRYYDRIREWFNGGPTLLFGKALSCVFWCLSAHLSTINSTLAARAAACTAIFVWKHRSIRRSHPLKCPLPRNLTPPTEREESQARMRGRRDPSGRTRARRCGGREGVSDEILDAKCQREFCYALVSVHRDDAPLVQLREHALHPRT